MKKLIKFFTLVACIAFFTSTTLNAQNVVRNMTNCTITVVVSYGIVSSCTPVGDVTFNVGPLSQVPIPILDVYGPLQVKGGYTNTGGALIGCPFYVAEACAGGPQVDNVTCAFACGDYTATLITNFGIIVN